MDDLEHLERQRADLKQRLDRFEAGDTDLIVTDTQRQAAAQYMRRALADFNALISAKKKSRRKARSFIYSEFGLFVVVAASSIAGSGAEFGHVATPARPEQGNRWPRDDCRWTIFLPAPVIFEVVAVGIRSV